jgi:hypothetical protein
MSTAAAATAGGEELALTSTAAGAPSNEPVRIYSVARS